MPGPASTGTAPATGAPDTTAPPAAASGSTPTRLLRRARQLTPLGQEPGFRALNNLVEVAGIEPASFRTSPGLLRAQPAVLFSAPAVTQASRRRAQSLLDVPISPATGLTGGSS